MPDLDVIEPLNPRYRLAPHIAACLSGQYVILMDTRRNLYRGIGSPEMLLLGRHIDNWPVCAGARRNIAEFDSFPAEREQIDLDSVASHDLARAALSEMAAERMLLERPEPGHPEEMASIAPPTAEIIEGYADIDVRISWLDLYRFGTAVICALVALKCLPFYRLVLRVRRRRKAAMTHTDVADFRAPGSLELGRQRVAVFRRLRPILYTASKACLFDSLALGNFLSKYGLRPSMVFGVSAAPFAAHCWLQQGEIIFNDDPLSVRQYTPILIL